MAESINDSWARQLMTPSAHNQSSFSRLRAPSRPVKPGALVFIDSPKSRSSAVPASSSGILFGRRFSAAQRRFFPYLVSSRARSRPQRSEPGRVVSLRRSAFSPEPSKRDKGPGDEHVANRTHLGVDARGRRARDGGGTHQDSLSGGVGRRRARSR